MFEIRKIDITKCPCVNYQQMLDIFGEEFIKLINKVSQNEGVLFINEESKNVHVGEEITYNETEFLVISVNKIGVLLLSASSGLLYWNYR